VNWGENLSDFQVVPLAITHGNAASVCKKGRHLYVGMTWMTLPLLFALVCGRTQAWPGPLKATSDAGSSPHILGAKILHVCSLSTHCWAKFEGEASFISAHFWSKILGNEKKNFEKFGQICRIFEACSKNFVTLVHIFMANMAKFICTLRFWHGTGI
jgi:hypothetical protein